MKKTYIAPETKNVDVVLCQMISVSGTLDKSQSITNSNQFGARGRGNDFWDEDEE